MSQIPAFGPIGAAREGNYVAHPPRIAPGNKGVPSFGDMVTGFMKDVNHLQNRSDEAVQKMVAGEVKDVHQVMLAVAEAKVSFSLLLEVRNKAMEAYQEVMKMRA